MLQEILVRAQKNSEIVQLIDQIELIVSTTVDRLHVANVPRDFAHYRAVAFFFLHLVNPVLIEDLRIKSDSKLTEEETALILAQGKPLRNTVTQLTRFANYYLAEATDSTGDPYLPFLQRKTQLWKLGQFYLDDFRNSIRKKIVETELQALIETTRPS